MTLLVDGPTASSSFDKGLERQSLAHKSLMPHSLEAFIFDSKQSLTLIDCSVTRKINNFAKRLLDVVTSIVLLLVLSPLLFCISIVVKLDGGSVFFRHVRVGKDLRAFECLKFRSMMPGAQEMLDEYLAYNPEDAALWQRERKLVFDPRITAVGKILRKTSLDELPQLVNVLRGEMSLVGPRPVTRDEVCHYGGLIAFYASVRPGMTGLWQVSGRSEIGFDARVVLDRCYASVHNILMDLAILLRTPAAVLSRRGAR